jgi:flagellar hook-length control protein FliK
MDGAAAPQVIESTPQKLSVGLHSGGLGWVEVHTSSSGGQIAATLASGTPEAHHAIASQLPAVREFLAGEHLRVDALASERFSASAGGQGGSSGDHGGDGGGRSARSQQQDRPAQTSVAEMDWDEMSYINVRA